MTSSPYQKFWKAVGWSVPALSTRTLALLGRRPDAARAIFYLGDEALEGGGDKTELDDIEAANLAIQKAKASAVTIHTYFGTSKSKHRSGIVTEYARVAVETGGQAFTKQDAIKGFSAVLEKVICNSRSVKVSKLKPGAVYVQDCISNKLSKLYTLDLATGKATFIGEIATEVSDIAFVGSQLYGLNRNGNKTQLVKIDLNSGDTTVIGDIGFACAGLAYNVQPQTLYATTAKQLIAINLKTGKGTQSVTLADKNYNCSEVAFDADGKAYITLIGYNKKKLLASCNLETSQVHIIGDTGFPDLASMEFIGDVLYGVTGNFFKLGKDGQLIRIDTTTGKGTLISKTNPVGRWPGISIYEPAKTVITEVASNVHLNEKTEIIEETWASLNGLKDEVILEVKEKTTLSGFFFDTYKEDNQGQIILAIEPVSAEEVANSYKQHSQSQTTSISTSSSTTSVSSSTSTDVSRTSVSTQSVSTGSVDIADVSRERVGAEASFNFRFDEAQMEQMWQQMAAKIETSVTITDEQDEKKEAYYWDNLEKWILKGYQSQAKNLAIQVARAEFMIKALTQQMEVSFNQNFQVWSGYFDKRLNDLVSTRISTMVSEQVNVTIANQTQEIKNLVVQQMQTDIDQRIDSIVNLKIANQSQEIKNQVIQQMQTDIDQRVDNVVNIKITNQSQDINNLVVQQIQTDIDQRIDNVVNIKVANQTQEINNLVIQQIQADVDQRIDNVVNLKIANQTQNIKNLVVQQMQTDIEQRIDALLNLKIANQTQEINNLVIQQIQTDIDQRIDSVVNLKISNQSLNIKNQVVQQIQTDIDQRIHSVVNQSTDNSVQVVVNNVINDVDNRINVNLENKILNFRNDVSTIIRNEINQNFTESIKTTVLTDIKKQQFYLDMQSIKTEVENFYARLGQFETQLYLRINQGDTQLYNWTLEQLVALQGCLTDRQALVELFESFAVKLKTDLDNAPCVNTNRFTSWVGVGAQPQLSPVQPFQLPGN